MGSIEKRNSVKVRSQDANLLLSAERVSGVLDFGSVDEFEYGHTRFLSGSARGMG